MRLSHSSAYQFAPAQTLFCRPHASIVSAPFRYDAQPMSPLDNIRIVLVNSIYGGNVGSACRAMMNMGLSQLVLVNPRPGMDMNDAAAMACHAGDILQNRKEFPTVAEAVADCGLVAGTSNRGGLYREHSKTPHEWAPRLLQAAQDTPVAILFGSEDNGLSLDDLALCTQFIRIPSSENYKSLNVAMSVMICAYELFVVSGTFELRRSASLNPLPPCAKRCSNGGRRC